MTNRKYTYLALGDSYTIGEGLPLHQSFPYQAVQLLRAKQINISAPEIIARTGWTTFELDDQLQKTILQPPYDFVTLCIGVNNQYRNLPAEEYSNNFDSLLTKAIDFAGGNALNVIVLSIPDWGVTPFAHDRNAEKIAGEIDIFNAINKKSSALYSTNYIDVTPLSRQLMRDKEYLAEDLLHPANQLYTIWAEMLTDVVLSILNND